MSFWGKVFGTEKALERVVDGVYNGLDKLAYTDEEKAEKAAQDRTEARAMVVKWMEATQGQNLARRVLALSITGVWLLQYTIFQIVSIWAIFRVDDERLHDVAKVMYEGAIAMNGPVMMILAFYFAAPHMGSIAETVLSKFKKGA